MEFVYNTAWFGTAWVESVAMYMSVPSEAHEHTLSVPLRMTTYVKIQEARWLKGYGVGSKDMLTRRLFLDASFQGETTVGVYPLHISEPCYEDPALVSPCEAM
eukprot:861699-Amphidinium_carterae.1